MSDTYSSYNFSISYSALWINVDLFSRKDTKTLHCAFLQGKTGILACKRYGSTALSYEQVRDDAVDRKHCVQVYFVKYYINTSLPLFLNYIACTNIVSETHRVMKFCTHLT